MEGGRNVPRSIERQLWSESIGHCMNPMCQTELIEDATNVGEMAHIIPHAVGGGVSFDNLILLCRKCHTQIDRNATGTTVYELQKWKENRNIEIQHKFEKYYNSFEELKNVVVPILERNGQICDNYGPANSDSQSEEKHALWLKFEAEIISNNRRLKLILNKNLGLFHNENQQIIDEFVAHTHEFVETRNDNPIQRVMLFPRNLLSIFGIEKDDCLRLVPNVSAIQNFVTHLIDEGRFVQLHLLPNQVLVYRENGNLKKLDLGDRPNVLQILFSGRYYRPITTEVRLADLIFFLEWLVKNNVSYKFKSKKNLTELILNGTHRIKLCYKYCLSLSDLHEIEIEDGLKVVNLHNWNGATSSKDAREYASKVGITLFNQNQFFIFAHKNIK